MVGVTAFVAVFVTICQQGFALPLEVGNSPYGQTQNITANLAYLRKYDYLSQKSDEGDSLLRVIDIDTAVRRLQLYGNVPQTGQFDAATTRLMQTPRCGVPDPVGVSTQSRDALGGALEKRYAHTGGIWEKTRLTYRILNTAGNVDITGAASDNAIRQAFKVWSDITPLIFEERTQGFADIYLKFGAGYHGDQYPFDGFSGTLAHAYPPMSGFGDLDGDVHFDDAEPYTAGTPDGINLFQVAAHEIGHAIGLAHSSVPGALMAPFYQGYDPDFQLPYDDTLGAQTLYGSQPDNKPGEPPAKTPKPDITSKPDVTIKPGVTNKPTMGCNTLSFHAIGYIRSELFAFNSDRYWRIRTPTQLLTPVKGDETKYFWYGLPASINAAYERYHDQRILFFKGDQYWEYNGLNALTGFPKQIKDLDQGLPSNIDAVLTYNEYLKTYFFKGSQVWRFDEGTQTLDAGWPYPIQDIFPGIPSDLGAAFRYKDGIPIFVKGSQYYAYNDATRSVDRGYPKSFGEDFLGCSPDQLENGGGGENGASTRTPTLLGVVLGSLIMVLNQFL